MFRFRLAALLTYREHQRRQCQQLLAERLTETGRLEGLAIAASNERDATVAEMTRIAAAPRTDVDQLLMRRQYAVSLQYEQAELSRQRQLVDQQVSLCRAALVRADAGVKALERLREKQQIEYEQAMERREARQREEAWQAARILRESRS